MLDFSAFKKAQTTIHTVGHGGIEQGGFNHPALGIAAVQHGHLAARGHAFVTIAVPPIAQQLFDFFHHPISLGQIARGLHHPHGFACTLGGVQVFAQAGFVVFDQLVGGVQDMAVAAVVLLQLDLMTHLVLAHKVGHVAHPRTAKGVNALIVIAHSQH